MKCSFEIIIRNCPHNSAKVELPEVYCIGLIIDNIPNVTKYSLINALVQYCPKTKKDFIYVTGHHQGKYRFNAFRIDYDNSFKYVSIKKRYVNHIERLDNYPGLDSALPTSPDVVLIAPSPIRHNMEFETITRAYNDCIAANKTCAVLYAEGQATVKWLLDELPVEMRKIAGAASASNLLAYIQNPSVIGIFFNGDGETTGLSCAEGTTFEFSDIAVNEFEGNLSQLDFVSASCVAFNYPFGSMLVEGYKIKSFTSGLTELVSYHAPDGEGFWYAVGAYGSSMFKNIVYNKMTADEALLKSRLDPTVNGILTGTGIFEYGVWATAGENVKDIFPKGEAMVGDFSNTITKKMVNGSYPVYDNKENIMIDSADMSQFKYIVQAGRNVYPLITFSVTGVIAITNIPENQIFETSIETGLDNVQTLIICNEYTGLLPDKDVSFTNSYAYNRYMVGNAPGSCRSLPLYDIPWWVAYNEEKAKVLN